MLIILNKVVASIQANKNKYGLLLIKIFLNNTDRYLEYLMKRAFTKGTKTGAKNRNSFI